MRPGHAGDHSPHSSAAIMEEWSYTSTQALGHTGHVTRSFYLLLYIHNVLLIKYTKFVLSLGQRILSSKKGGLWLSLCNEIRTIYPIQGSETPIGSSVECQLLFCFKPDAKYKKVKCALIQALRLCTGRTAHAGSRGITLLYRH